MRSYRALLALALAPALAAAAPTPASPPYDLPALSRADFNRLAVEAGLPLFWVVDSENPGIPDASELAFPNGGPKATASYLPKGVHGKPFEAAYRRLVELRRREAVRAELAAARPTLLETDTSAYTAEERALVARFQTIARLIDQLFELQHGSAGLEKKIPKDDAASRALFWRNHGPWCEAPATENDPFCNATPDFTKRKSLSYPVEGEQDKAFCEALAAAPNAKDLLAPFTVVRPAKTGGYEAVPYARAYAKPMKAIAKELKAAAAGLQSTTEVRLAAYLTAAAKAFETDDWSAADEAWSLMAGSKSAWYVRVGPDETYWDPCGVKAGFHLSFARQDPAAAELKAKLEAIRGDMEKAVAALVAPEVYAAREVGFQLPDFIQVVLNAGDSRSAIGATIGQSLPNFGKVAEESRGRTVVMSNLYTDADSLAAAAEKDALLLDSAALALRDASGAAGRMGTVLHEAMHNLGPTGSWLVGDQKSEAIFGGDLDAILEESKAEIGAVFLMPLLVEKGILTTEQHHQALAAVLSWGFGQLANGLSSSDGRPKTYSHVAAILLSKLVSGGALTWIVAEGDAEGGRFAFDPTKVQDLVKVTMTEIVRIKAAGDKEAGLALDAAATTPEVVASLHVEEITQRFRRFPKATFIYAVK